MHTFLIILRKDLKASRLKLAAIWALALIAIVCPQQGALRDDLLGWAGLSLQLSVICFLAALLLPWMLFGKEPPYGTTRFIATRPVSGRSICASKLAVFLLGGIFPMVLMVWGGLQRSGLRTSLTDRATVVGYDLWALMALGGLLTVRHAFRSPIWRSLFTVIGILLTTVAFVLAGQHELSRQPDFEIVVLALMTLGWSSWVLLATKYMRWATGARVIAMAIVGSLTFWLGLAARDDGSAFPLSPQKNDVDFQLTLDARREGLEALPQGRNGDMEIRYFGAMRGLPEGVFAEQSAFEGTLTVQGNPQVHSFQVRDTSFGWTLSPAAVIGVLPGSPSLTKEQRDHWARYYLPAAKVTLPTLRKGDVFYATLRGQHHFDLYKAELQALIPLKEGTVWKDQNIRLQMHDVTDRYAVVMEIDALETGSRTTGRSLPLGLGNRAFFGVNLPARQLCHIDTLTAANLWHPLQQRKQCLENWSFKTQIRWNAPGETQTQTAPEKMDPAQTQLGVFRRVHVGHATVPFEWVNEKVVVQ